jgi:hypothetical protein
MLDQRVDCRGVAIFADAGLSTHKTDGGAVIDRVLAVETLRDIAFVA